MKYILINVFIFIVLPILITYIYDKIIAKSCNKCWRYYLDEGKCCEGSELYKECHKTDKSSFQHK